MFKLNLKIAWRNLVKNKGYTFINVTGLAIGMASCILIFLFVRHELSFDEGFTNEKRIYRFVTDWRYAAFDDYSSGAPIPVIKTAKEEIAGLEKTAAIVKRYSVVHVKDDSGKDIVKSDEPIYYVEPDFFEIFNVTWFQGKPAQALAQPNTVTLAKATAVKYFGSAAKAIGKTITLGSKTNLRVTGVFQDMPENSSFPLKIVISYQTFPDKDDDCWDCVNSSTSIFVLLKEGINTADVQPAIDAFNKKYYTDQRIAGNQLNRLQPLREIHFSENYANFADTTIGKSKIAGLIVIGLFLILTACINFINLTTAQAINRSKEVGVRKVMGSMRKQLIWQFLMETLLVTLTAMLVACVLAELAIPQMQELFNNRITFSLFQHPVIFGFMALLILGVAFLAGFYPAIVMSGFDPALAIKNKLSLNTTGLSLRKVLVVVQFSISIVLIISTLVVINQMAYMKEKPLGFNPQQVAMIGIPNDSLSRTKHLSFKERLLKIPGVKLVSFCQSPPLSANVNSSDFSYNGVKNKDFELRTTRVDDNYFKVFDLKIIAGKGLAKSDTANGYVVNETFIKKMYLKSPNEVLGKKILVNGNSLPIVGVVADFNDKSLQEGISGLAMSVGKNQYWNVAVKLEGDKLMSTMSKTEDLWNSMFPNSVYQASFVNDTINGYYETEKVMGVLFKVFASVIIFISFIGLLGLISFVATQRTKEMAIRKVLGATTFELVKLLNGSFLLMVFIANLIAWPIAYILINSWLNGFAYRMQLSFWPFVIAMCLTMLITLLTVSLRSYKAAVANTISALKYE
jgi:putative ABC transport system permease protein